jgi:hypothetical protein
VHTHTCFILEVNFIFQLVSELVHSVKDLFLECDPHLFVTSIFLITPFIMNSSQLSSEDPDIKLFKVFNKLKNVQHSKVSHKELKKVKQEKESLIVQLS